jgi:D-alanine-D-alanine ligase-like ATP-grasp enzyme
VKTDIKKRVGILRGGAGKHYESSLRQGGEIISHILGNLSDKYKTVDILIDKNGIWHINGMPIKPADLMHKVDVVWNTSRHPGSSMTLNSLSIPNISNESFFGALENSSDMLRTHMKSIGIQMPKSIVLPLYQKDFDGPAEKYAIKKAKWILEKFGAPWIIKSFTPDSNMGIHLAKTFPELVEAIEDGVMHKKSILVEEFISGKVFSIHSLAQFRGEDVYIFPPENSLINEKEKITDLVKNLHKHLGIRYYLKSDFTLHPKKGFFLTNVDFSPDFRSGSHFDQSSQYVGAKTHHIIGHILERALNGKV